MTPTLRDARDTDAGKLGQMISDAVAARAWKPVLHSGAQDIAHTGDMIDRGWVRVAELDGRVAGFIARERGYIHALFVTPDLQGHGIGSALLHEAQSHGQALTLWVFEQNTDALRFYLRAGFAETHRTAGENDEALPDIHLRWTPAPTQQTETKGHSA
ncbi:MAG: GNAT family N-acetyltransferase [Pelagimonas sp.]|nr:GNAT family N-acetyltransferase [Pelagimonas sp.]